MNEVKGFRGDSDILLTRFNRRFDLPDIIPRLVYVALRTPSMPERLLKLRLA